MRPSPSAGEPTDHHHPQSVIQLLFWYILSPTNRSYEDSQTAIIVAKKPRHHRPLRQTRSECPGQDRRTLQQEQDSRTLQQEQQLPGHDREQNGLKTNRMFRCYMVC